MAIKLPELGEKISPTKGAILCNHFHLDYLAEEIANSLFNYKSFYFDGCSMIPDAALEYLTKESGIWTCVLYKVCLPHDLAYAYSRFFSTEENKAHRKTVDKIFYHGLLICNVPKVIARIMLKAVRIGGADYLRMPFSWSFARREEVSNVKRIR